MTEADKNAAQGPQGPQGPAPSSWFVVYTNPHHQSHQ
jgi:hypothetical protein